MWCVDEAVHCDNIVVVLNCVVGRVVEVSAIAVNSKSSCV